MRAESISALSVAKAASFHMITVQGSADTKVARRNGSLFPAANAVIVGIYIVHYRILWYRINNMMPKPSLVFWRM